MYNLGYGRFDIGLILHYKYVRLRLVKRCDARASSVSCLLRTAQRDPGSVFRGSFWAGAADWIVRRRELFCGARRESLSFTRENFVNLVELAAKA